jgi:hypothetical protein
MPIRDCVLALALLVWSGGVSRAEVFVRWDLDEVPSRDSLGIATLLIPASRPLALQDALAKGYGVVLDLDAASMSDALVPATPVSGVVVRGDASPQQLDALRQRLRSPGARVMRVDRRGLWPQVRLHRVTLRDDVLQVASRSAQPWLDSNAVFTRIAAAEGDATPLLLAPVREPVTAVERDQGPALEDYLLAIAEAGSFGHDLVLPLHQEFQRRLLLGQPAARAEWRDIRRYLEFFSWDLPRRHRRVRNVGVMTADPMASIEILRLFTRHNLPVEVVPSGALPGANLADFALIVALDPLAPAQIPPLAAFARSGGTVVLNGPPSGLRWEGAVPVAKDARQGAYRLGEGRLLQLTDPVGDPDEFALDVRNVLGPQGRVVDVWNGITVLVAPYEDPAGESMLVTIVDYAHASQPIPVRVKGTFSQAHYESPESEPVLLPLRRRNGYTEFDVPAPRVGGRVFLGRERKSR